MSAPPVFRWSEADVPVRRPRAHSTRRTSRDVLLNREPFAARPVLPVDTVSAAVTIYRRIEPVVATNEQISARL